MSSPALTSHRWRNHEGPPWVLLVVGGLAAALALSPLVYLTERAFGSGLGTAWSELAQRRTVELAARSLALTALATLACTVIGVGAALLVARTDLPGRSVWRVVLALPLAVPSYLAAYAWVSAKPSLAGFEGATLVLIACSYPYVYLPAVAALSRIDPATEEVARSLGAGPLRIALRVSLPQARPAITAGALLVALYVLSDFGAVGTMRYEAFTWVIYGAYRAGFNPTRAAVLSLALVAVAVVLVAAETRTRGRAAARLGGGAPRVGTVLRLGRAAPAAIVALGGLVVVALGFPLASLAVWLGRSVRADVDLGELGRTLLNSAEVSILAAVATVALAVPIGLLAARHRSKVTTTMESATYAAHALPGVVIGIATVFAGVRIAQPLYQRTPLLVIAYVVLFLPLAVGSVRAAVEQTPVQMEEVARSLGYSRARARLVVTGRLAAPGVAAGAALTFLAAMKELPATLLLHPTGMDTLATKLWSHTSVSDYGGAAPYAAALVVFAALPTAVLGWLSGRMDATGT